MNKRVFEGEKTRSMKMKKEAQSIMSGRHIDKKWQRKWNGFLVLGLFLLSILGSFAFSESKSFRGDTLKSVSVDQILESVKSMAASLKPETEAEKPKLIPIEASATAGKGATSVYDADINQDGFVDAFDLIVLITDFGKMTTGPSR